MDEVLKKIRDYADEAHGTQTRKYCNDRYIVHPIRVMELCRNYDDDVTVLATALLHDVLEDTPVTSDEMQAFLNTVMDTKEAHKTVAMVIELTDIFTKKHYPEWNRRVRKEKELERLELISAQAQTIKYADIMDNCKEIVREDEGFAPKFLHECRKILSRLTRGNAALRQQAIATVQKGLDEL